MAWSCQTLPVMPPGCPAPRAVPTPNQVSAVEEIYVTQSWAGAKARLHVSWLPVEHGFTRPLSGGLGRSSITQLWVYPAAFPSEMGTEHYLYDLPPATYIISVRAINIFNVSGLWSPYFNIVVRLGWWPSLTTSRISGSRPSMAMRT